LPKDGPWWFGAVASCNPDFLERGVSVTLFETVTLWKTEGLVFCSLPATPESLLSVRQCSCTNERKTSILLYLEFSKTAIT